MSESFTISGSGTYTEADVKAVLQNTYEDIIGFANRKLVEHAKVKGWIEDLTFLLNKKVLKSFEIQLYNSANERFKSYRYQVNASGSLSSGSLSGGINYFEIPDGTKFGFLVDADFTQTNSEEIKKYLYTDRNYGQNGSAMEGTVTYERSHISGALELKRSSITKP